MTNEILKFVAITFLAGSLYAIIGVLIDNTLYRVGIARKMTVPVIIIAYFLAFLKMVWHDKVPWLGNLILFILIITLGLNRGDIWSTKDHGRWWWKSEK